jgi:hypothetical protein
VLSQLRVDLFPLAHQEVSHHLLAAGQGSGFQLIQRGLPLQAAGVEGGNLDGVQFRYPLGVVVVDPLDHDAKAAHGLLLRQNGQRDAS